MKSTCVHLSIGTRAAIRRLRLTARYPSASPENLRSAPVRISNPPGSDSQPPVGGKRARGQAADPRALPLCRALRFWAVVGDPSKIARRDHGTITSIARSVSVSGPSHDTPCSGPLV